jgi:hypothetical protein
MRILRRAGCLASVIAAVATDASAQGTRHPTRENWLEMVRVHESEAVDEAVEVVIGWREDHLQKVLLHQILRDKGVTAAVLDRGLTLHTDIALVERAAAERGLLRSAGRSTGLMILDGRTIGVVPRSYHWTAARRIANVLVTRPDGAPRALAWYRAIAALLQQFGDTDVLRAHLADAARLFPDDAILAMYRGTQHQTFADPRVQLTVRHRLSKLRGPGSPQNRFETVVSSRPGGSMNVRVEGQTGLAFLPMPAKAELEEAAREFRRALSGDATLVEARIRLAHVTSDLGAYAEAADLLRPALAEPLPAFLEGYGALILARCEEALGRYAEAGAAYARVAARFPGAQSAAIGLSRIALVQGRATDALATILAAGDPDAPEPFDPWTHYFRMHAPEAPEMVRAWRDQ